MNGNDYGYDPTFVGTLLLAAVALAVAALAWEAFNTWKGRQR